MLLNFVKSAGDLVGLGKKVSTYSEKCPRTQGVFRSVIGKIVNMGIMVAMLAGAVKYGIELLCSSKEPRNINVKSKLVVGMAA